MTPIKNLMIIEPRTYISRFTIGLMMLLLSGCATFESAGEIVSGVTSYFLGGIDNIEPPAELVEFEPEIELEILWDEQIGVGTQEQLVNLIISLSYGQIVVADREGLVVARKAESGDLVWEVETDYNFSSGPGIGSDIVILATSNAEVVALNIDTGEEKWTTSVSSEVLATPLVAQNTVVLRTTDGKIVALNQDNGSQIWTFERSVPALSIRGTGSPVLIDDRIVAGYANGKLIELRLLDGKNLWETSIAIPSGRSEVERLVDLDVDPVETDGVVFISSYQGGTAAILELDGDVLWRNEDVSSSSGLSYDWRYLYISDTESKVWQLDQRNGASLWKQDELYNRSLTAPVAYDDYIVVGDYDGYMHWLAASDGRQLGRIKVSDSAIVTKPIVVDNTVYVYATDGTLAALKAKLF